MLTVNNPWQFRIGATDKVQAYFLAAYVYHVMNYRSVDIVTDSDFHSRELSKVFSRELKKHGGKINKFWALPEENERDQLTLILEGLKQYAKEVEDGDFPEPENWFGMSDEEYDELMKLLDN